MIEPKRRKLTDADIDALLDDGAPGPPMPGWCHAEDMLKGVVLYEDECTCREPCSVVELSWSFGDGIVYPPTYRARLPSCCIVQLLQEYPGLFRVRDLE